MAILYGTQSNGETLPVLVDQFGNLIAKGIDGAPGQEGPQGPPGPPGIGELPPGATDGALLGWQDGELVWVTEPAPPLFKGFRAILWTGNGGTQSIDCGFSPDLVWLKSRTSNTANHGLFDTVRGAGMRLVSNTNNAESLQPTTLTSFDSNGFTIGSDAAYNTSANNYVAWCWKAGDTTVINTEGTITSQVRSNGNFSVVKWKGTGSNGLVGHSLNSAPKWIIVKALNSLYSQDWTVYSEDLSNGKLIKLNTNAGVNDNGNLAWNSTSPTSTVFSLGTGNAVNESDTDFIAYCWDESPTGSFGSYTGTGSRFQVSTGFSPSLVIIKSTETGEWFMFDNARGNQQTLRANLADREDQTGVIEFLDDGFQVLFALPGINQSNVSYIYAAFANPEDAAFATRQLRRQARQEERQQNETQPRLRQ